MKILSRPLFVLIAISLLPLSAWAQQDGPTWSRMNLVTVKPQYLDEFMELQKEISAGAKERGVPWRAAWMVGNFGTNYQFAFISPIDSFADLDTPGDGNAEIFAKFLKYISARESHASIYRLDLSKPLADGKAPKLAIVQTNTIAPGREADYAAFIKNDVLPYMSDPKTGIEGFEVLTTIFGGSTTWTWVVHINEYAYIDGGSIASRTLDETALAALSKKQVGLVTHVERIIGRYIPELSYFPGSSTTSSNDPE